MKRIETLRHLQLVSIAIYKDLREFCNENGLQVYVHGGTLIGAIRHKGFIPWDDDIDVCMSRPDYEKMLKISKGRISENCIIIDPERNSEFNGYISLAIFEKSKLRSKQYKNKENLKIGISIFVYDGAPKTVLERKIYYMHMYILRAKHALCRANFTYANTSMGKIFGPIFQKFFKNKDVKKYKIKILRLMQKYKYEESKYVAPNADTNAIREVFLRKDFEKKQEVIYEGIKSYTYSYYDAHLKKYYGDYMKLPSYDARNPKHSFDAWIDKDFIFGE